MPAQLAVALLGPLAQLPELFGIVEDVGEPLLLLAGGRRLGGWPVEGMSEALLVDFVRPPGTSSRLAGFVERMREAFLLPGRRLVPGLLYLRRRRKCAVLAEAVAELPDGEPRAGSAERHGVEVGAVLLLIGQDGLAGGGEHLGHLAPIGPSVEAGNRKALLFSLTLEGPVYLYKSLRGLQIVLGSLLRCGLVLVVLEEPAEHVAGALRDFGMIGKRANTRDQPLISPLSR